MIFDLKKMRHDLGILAGLKRMESMFGDSNFLSTLMFVDMCDLVVSSYTCSYAVFFFNFC